MPKNLKKLFVEFLKYWLPFVLWAIVIFTFSSNPTVKTSEVHWQDFVLKKSAHVVEYFIFSLLLFRAIINSKLRMKNQFVFIVLTAFIYGLTDEFHQSFTPGREPKLRDALFDLLGSLLFVLSYKYIVVRRSKLENLAKMIQLVR